MWPEGEDKSALVQSIELWTRVPSLYDSSELEGGLFEENNNCLFQTPILSVRLHKHGELAINLHGVAEYKAFIRDDFSGKWLHLAFVLHTAKHQLTVYQNGDVCHLAIVGEAASKVKNGSTVADVYRAAEAGRAVRVASTTESDSGALLGHVSEFRLWSTVRSAAEIAAMMSVRATGAEAGLLACLPFTETVSADQPEPALLYVVPLSALCL